MIYGIQNRKKKQMLLSHENVWKNQNEMAEVEPLSDLTTLGEQRDAGACSTGRRYDQS